eukprot:526367_1
MSNSTRKRRKSRTEQPNDEEHPTKKSITPNSVVIIDTITAKLKQSKIGYILNSVIKEELKIKLIKTIQTFIMNHFQILQMTQRTFLIYAKENINFITTIYYEFEQRYANRAKKSTSPNLIKEINISFEQTIQKLEAEILKREAISTTTHTFTITYASKQSDTAFHSQYQPKPNDKTKTIVTFFKNKILLKKQILVKIVNCNLKSINNNINKEPSRASHSEILDQNEMFTSIQLPLKTNNNKWKNTNKKSDLDEVNENNIISIDNFT